MPVRLDAVLEAVELPARVTDLAASLTNMDGDAFTLKIIWMANNFYVVKSTRSKGSVNLPQGFAGITMIFKDF